MNIPGVWNLKNRSNSLLSNDIDLTKTAEATAPDVKSKSCIELSRFASGIAAVSKFTAQDDSSSGPFERQLSLNTTPMSQDPMYASILSPLATTEETKTLPDGTDEEHSFSGLVHR